MNISTHNGLSFEHWMRIFLLESQAELLKTFRSPGFVIPSLTFPLMFYVFFGLVFNKGAQVPLYLMATYGVFGIIGPALFSFGVDVASDKDKGQLSLKLVSPMPIESYFAARILTAMVFALIIIMSLFSVGAIFGDVVMTRSQWLSTLLVLLVGTLPFCAFGLFIGLTVKAKASAAVVNLIYLPMAFLSGLWIPIHMFPDVLSTMANIFPAYHLAQLVLKIQENDLGTPWYWHVGVLAFYTVVFLLLSARQFKRLEESK